MAPITTGITRRICEGGLAVWTSAGMSSGAMGKGVVMGRRAGASCTWMTSLGSVVFSAR